MGNRTRPSFALVLLTFLLPFLAFCPTAAHARPDASTSALSPIEAPSDETGAEPLIEKLKSVRGVAADTWDVVLFKLALAGALGLTLAVVYRASYTGKRKKYKPSMMQSQLLLCIGGALIWIIVAGNIVRAFGLAGALALIRYRTVVRDPKDTVIVFLSMLVGMACGLAQYYVALVSTGFISLALFAMYQFRLGKKKEKKKKKKKPETEEVFSSADEDD